VCLALLWLIGQWVDCCRLMSVYIVRWIASLPWRALSVLLGLLGDGMLADRPRALLMSVGLIDSHLLFHPYTSLSIMSRCRLSAYSWHYALVNVASRWLILRRLDCITDFPFFLLTLFCGELYKGVWYVLYFVPVLAAYDCWRMCGYGARVCGRCSRYATVISFALRGGPVVAWGRWLFQGCSLRKIGAFSTASVEPVLVPALMGFLVLILISRGIK